MLENSFIKLSPDLPNKCDIIKPIALGESFILSIIKNASVHLTDTDGNTYDHLLHKQILSSSGIFDIVQIDIFLGVTPHPSTPQDNTCCYIHIEDVRSQINSYSNMLVFMNDTDGLSKVSYRCDADAFGFPFSLSNAPIVSWLPINLKNPQLKQEDKTYVKRTGEVVVLMAKYYKEWDAESEYISEDMHDKIVSALSCDYVYINDVRMTKSDSYEIDWENKIKKACGQKLAKATWKMRANIMERNSNC